MIGLILVVFLSLIFVGIPVAFTLVGTGIYVMFAEGIFNPVTVAHNMYSGLDQFPFLAIPFFILAGEIMGKAGLTQKLMDFAYSAVGRFRGGLAHVAILVAMIFAAMSGSAVATAAAIGSLLLPEMVRKGYDKGFSSALIAAGGAIGPIIPPSIPMILYAVIAGQSVERMFLVGVVPGVLYGISLMAYSTYYAKKRNLPRDESKFSFKDLLKAFKKGFLPLLTPVIIMGGILSGIFTATESAVITVVYSLFLGLVVYKTIKLSDLYGVSISAARSTVSIMLILAGSAVLNWVLTSQQIPQQVATALISMSDNPTVIMFYLMGLVLILGCFMDATAIILLISPIAIVVLNAYGIDLAFFGVLIVINVCIGALTPPVGANLFVASRISGTDLIEISRAVLPMVFLAVLLLVICILFPNIILFLPNYLLG